MPRRILALVQDSHDDDRVVAHDVEEEVGADPIAAITEADLVRGPPTRRVLCDTFGGRVELEHVGLCLCPVPALFGVVPDLGEIITRGRRDEQGSQRCLPAMKESMSRASGVPLSSPAPSAERRARICAS